jgi:ribose/xylose/arabinose/galactoside ABC-type transport system permease subunit
MTTIISVALAILVAGCITSIVAVVTAILDAQNHIDLPPLIVTLGQSHIWPELAKRLSPPRNHERFKGRFGNPQFDNQQYAGSYLASLGSLGGLGFGGNFPPQQNPYARNMDLGKFPWEV